MAKIELEEFIRDVPDFPIKGIMFKDITPLLGSYEATRHAIGQLAEMFKDKGIQYVVGIESRGFVFGSLLADRLKAGFVPVRKPNKLPYKTVKKSYSLEYGANTIEMHIDAFPRGAKILMVDDLLATGGTMAAACELVRELGGDIVGAAFIVELDFLNGRQRLGGCPVHSLIHYGAE